MQDLTAEGCFQTATHLTYVYTHNVCDNTAAITHHGFWDYMVYIPLSVFLIAVAGAMTAAFFSIVRENF